MRLKWIVIVGLALIVAEVLGILVYNRREAYMERQVDLLRGGIFRPPGRPGRSSSAWGSPP